MVVGVFAGVVLVFVPGVVALRGNGPAVVGLLGRFVLGIGFNALPKSLPAGHHGVPLWSLYALPL